MDQIQGDAGIAIVQGQLRSFHHQGNGIVDVGFIFRRPGSSSLGIYDHDTNGLLGVRIDQVFISVFEILLLGVGI